MKKALSFDDVLLVPKYSEIRSRSHVNISSKLLRDHELPVIASPMDTVTEEQMAVAMDKAGGLGIIHRYNSIEEQVEIVEKVVEQTWSMARCVDSVAAAIGATGDFKERATALVEAGVRILCVDTAHGHHITMRKCLETLKKTFDNKIHIMAGNVATIEAYNDLADWGADSIRVGIGGGSICSTRLVSGHGVPTLQSVLDCARSTRDVIMIADGGIKTTGDMVKALAAGADFVMVGSFLAGTD